MKRKGFLLTIVSPSGGGKSTVCNELLKQNKDLTYSISWTTRPIRGVEVDGVNYVFTDCETFLQKVKENFFLEYANVHGNYYGTSKEFVDNCLSEEKVVLFDIDVQGVELIKKKGYSIVTVFLLPPNEGVLQKRLIDRKTDSAETINLRLKNVKKEIEYLNQYDYLVINDDVQIAIQTINSILLAERNRVHRYTDPVQEFFNN